MGEAWRFNPFTGSFDAVEDWTFDAACGASDEVGHFVYMVSAGVVAKVDIADPSTMPACGLIVAKATATSCAVQTLGELETTGLIAGKTYVVGTDSKLSPTPFSRPTSGRRAIQSVGKARSTTQLILRPSTHMTVVLP